MRQKIVEAARKRFSHYGYSKTTMAEVASDCNMSPGNLYRYFPGKLDIAEEIRKEATETLWAQVQRTVDAAGPGATVRLKAYLMKMLEVTYDQIQYQEKVHEIALILRNERPENWARVAQEDRQRIAKFLEEGCASGEFVLADPNWAAEVIQSATLRFRYPQVHDNATLPVLKRELETLLDMLLFGIAPESARRSIAADSRREFSTAAHAEEALSENYFL